MLLIVIETPFAPKGEYPNMAMKANLDYARICLFDSVFMRLETPLMSHLLIPQVLNDDNNDERAMGIDVQKAYIKICNGVAVYDNLGISSGMKAGIEFASKIGKPVEFRTLSDNQIDEFTNRLRTMPKIYQKAFGMDWIPND